MQIVIDIPEDVYKPIIKAYKKDKELQTRPNLYKAVANGTPLPKGHGRLIDADDIPNQIELKGFLQQDDAHLVTIQRVKEALDTSPTIIEAESEVEE